MTAFGLDQVTIVVPTRNEEANIETFLRSLPPVVRLIVVDSSEDGTPELIERCRPSATVVRAELNIPEARQLGANLAVTPWLLFTDADVRFPADYFPRLEKVTIDDRVGGLVGTKSTADGFDTYHRWFARGQAVLHAFGVPAATGSNMLVRGSTLEAVGGFDRRLTVNEDTEVMFRIAKAGYDVGFEPGLRVLATDHRRLEAGLARKIVHGAVRNSALWLGVLGPQVRSGDWGYWNAKASQPAPEAGR